MIALSPRETMVDRRLARDPACDGRFTVAVVTTGISCRPSCRTGRQPKPHNVRFYPSPDDARAAGFRPCKRCRPDEVATGTATARIAYLDRVETAVGPVAFAVDGTGALVALKFLDAVAGRTVEAEVARLGLHPEPDPDRRRTAVVCRQLEAYAAGERRRFDLPLALAGSPWQQAVWRALTRIPFGETRTYAEVAATTGRPGAARAVGRANAANRIALVVPCHRVIGADGSLTGYEGGTHLKARLLAHEARVLAGAACEAR